MSEASGTCVYFVEKTCIQVEAWLSVGGKGVWVGYGMGEASGEVSRMKGRRDSSAWGRGLQVGKGDVGCSW